jgi:hypothetical protein
LSKGGEVGEVRKFTGADRTLVLCVRSLVELQRCLSLADWTLEEEGYLTC